MTRTKSDSNHSSDSKGVVVNTPLQGIRVKALPPHRDLGIVGSDHDRHNSDFDDSVPFVLHGSKFCST